jgi:ATP-dependent RNA/DNA helicase IGHMBP2
MSARAGHASAVRARASARREILLVEQFNALSLEKELAKRSELGAHDPAGATLGAEAKTAVDGANGEAASADAAAQDAAKADAAALDAAKADAAKADAAKADAAKADAAKADAAKADAAKADAGKSGASKGDGASKDAGGTSPKAQKPAKKTGTKGAHETVDVLRER